MPTGIYTRKNVRPIAYCKICQKQLKNKNSLHCKSHANSIKRKGCKLSLETRAKMSAYWSGRPRGKYSEERKRKIGEKSKGRRCKEEVKEYFKKIFTGRKHPNPRPFGYKHTEKSRLKMSQSAKKGKEHIWWRGGITQEHKRIRTSLEYKFWREAVFKRDDFTCQICKKRGGELHPDHIKPFAYFPELRFDINNGRTLCAPCHRKTDTWGTNARLKYEKLYKLT